MGHVAKGWPCATWAAPAIRLENVARVAVVRTEKKIIKYVLTFDQTVAV